MENDFIGKIIMLFVPKVVKDVKAVRGKFVQEKQYHEAVIMNNRIVNLPSIDKSVNEALQEFKEKL